MANWLFDDAGMLEKIVQEDMPIVVVGRDLSARNIHSVLVDNEAGGDETARHFHQLGHRRIAVIRGPQQLADSARRWKGVERFARESGWRINPQLVRDMPVTLDPFSAFEGGIKVTADLIDAGEPFTALIAFDDVTALGALRALNHAGLRTPHDCSVLGFDDIPQAALSTPALSTVRQPMEAMGAFAARRAMSALGEAGRSGPMLELFPPELVRRDSTAGIE